MTIAPRLRLMMPKAPKKGSHLCILWHNAAIEAACTVLAHDFPEHIAIVAIP